MPESPLPPTWGPAYDERDLDALLSGETVSLPEALIPLAGTLAALNARPVRAEMAGEAAARAAFRQLVQDPMPSAGDAQHGTVPPHTLVLHRPRPDGRRRHKARHRRRSAGAGLRRPATFAGAATALVIVAGIAAAALFPGQLRRASWSSSTAPAATATGSGQASSAPRVDATGAPAPIIQPTPGNFGAPGTATERGALCREYYAFFNHPEPASARAAQEARKRTLDRLAKGQWNVLSYCLPYVDYTTWAGPAESAGNEAGNQHSSSLQNESGPGAQGHGHSGDAGGSTSWQSGGQGSQG